MFDILVKYFIKDYDKTEDQRVRTAYGIMSSILSIILNGLLVVLKIISGYMTNSMALLADGFNNLSDMGSNLATLFGFKLADKHPDKEHPYGHGRIEYVAGLIISFIIIYVGFSTIVSSISLVINPEEVMMDVLSVIVIILGIVIKLFMAYFNKTAASRIRSEALAAAGQDAKNDVLTSVVTLISLISSQFFDLPIDGIASILVSLFVIKSGIDIFKSTLDPLLGLAPDKELVEAIIKFIREYEVVEGIHDLMIHDYGPGRRFMTLHVEVDSHKDMMEVHDTIDTIEREVQAEFHIMTTIHMDPIDVADEKTIELKKVVKEVTKGINENYDIHDFRIVSGPTHTNLIFDVVVPADERKDPKEIVALIEGKIKDLNENYYCVIEVDYSYY